MGQYPDFTGGQDNTEGWENTRPIDEEPTAPLTPAPGYPAAAPTYDSPPAPGYAESPTAPTYAEPSPTPAYGGPTPYGAPAPYPQAMAPVPYGAYSGNPYALGEHPQAQMVFILGIVGIFTGIPAFVAWYMGAQARKEIQAGAPYRWEGNLKTGYLLGKVFGIIGIVGTALAVVFWIIYVVLMIALLGMM